MFRLLLISFVVPISVVAQLESFLSISSFNSNEGPYIETYLSVNSNTLKLIKNSESFYSGKVSVLINIYSNDSLYFSDKYILESPNYIFENNNNLFFIDQQRIKLNNGYYIINVDIKACKNLRCY